MVTFFVNPPFGNYLNLPNTIPIRGSFTIEPRPGLIGQIFRTLRYSFEYGGWINKIGLRNKGLKWAVDHYKPGSILSLALLANGDLDKALETVPENVDLELNLSCPNLEHNLSSIGIEKFLNSKRHWCIAKLGPECSEEQIDSLYHKGFRQFHFSNTLKLPNGRGGLSGPSLRYYTSKRIQSTREKYDDVIIIAGGGVRSRKDATNYLEKGANYVSVSTLCFNPLMFMMFYFSMFNKRELII